MTKSIDILKQDRAAVLSLIADLSEEQLLQIPDGFRNNILWNVGHLIVTQQLLHYRLSGLEPYVSREMIGQFRTGTDPSIWEYTPDVEHLKTLLLELPDRLAEDYQAGRFETFRGYTTQTGVRLEDLEDAIHFNHFHEGLHTGVIQSLRRFVVEGGG